MKFELKSENENHFKSFSNILKLAFFLALIILFSDVALKLRIISRHYQIEYNCNLLSVDKSKANFEKLSLVSNLKSKQRILDFCKKVVN